ncbi:MAG TPA: hypothetical protein ENK55_11330, partial [Actinobacteria bacterium]|nr:hypothetical protein [Actinomycetota bacterium]
MVSKVLGRTVELIGRRWQRLAPAALALGLLNALLNLLTGAAAERAVAAPDRLSPGLAWAILAAFVVAVVVGAATGALMLVLVADADRRGDPDVNDALDLVLRRLGAILGLVVVAFLLIFAGFLLLVLPGVWVAVALVPSLP